MSEGVGELRVGELVLVEVEQLWFLVVVCRCSCRADGCILVVVESRSCRADAVIFLH